MISLTIRRIEPDQRDRLERWLREVDGPRRQEALATLADEGVMHEKAVILDTSDGPILIYAMESADLEYARAVAQRSEHAIDAEHREVMQAAVAGRPDIAVVLDLRSGDAASQS
ncbi:DUF6176 family protein [Microbacterium oryzae]|uniref:DUF6176 family protein n=1 Tax=Microbacterium oryzae TaxID=743009 RepID=UPI0025B2564B|nr:DUF6176 family protein [Microbacterium oryzae]MDN3311750.1 DUF6176 family protein [Microbacterium oryzae]